MSSVTARAEVPRGMDRWRVETVDCSGATRKAWRDLACRSGNIFATPEWVDVWWEHLGDGEAPRLFAVMDEREKPIAFAPMAVGRIGMVRVVRFAGHGPADALGPVCDSQHANAALTALAASVKEGLLLAERIPATFAHGDGFIELSREASPCIDIGDGWEAYLRGRSANLRSQVRRKERKLARENGLVYRLTDAAHVDDDMDTLIGLHRQRWGEAGSGAFDGQLEPFHRQFARLALRRGWLRLWVAEVEGKHPIAAWYGFRFGGEEWYYQSGRDPFWDRSSVGLVLLAHTIRAAAEDGVARYRLLRGDETYKGRFATDDESVVTMGTGSHGAHRAMLRLGRVGAERFFPASLRRRILR